MEKTTTHDEWHRISQVVLLSGKTVNAFAKYIGLTRGENLYQIKRGNNGISKDVADRICAKFPQVSKLWLLTGEGQMLLSTGNQMEETVEEVCFHANGPRHDLFVAAALMGLLASGRYDKVGSAAVAYARETEAALDAALNANSEWS